MTALVSRRHSATVAGESRPLNSVIHVWTDKWSIFESGQVSHRATTWVRMIEASRAWVVASLFQDAIRSRAWSPNNTRPACGDT